MIYLITKNNDEEIVIGELTGYSMFNKKIIKEIRFAYEHKKVKEWVDNNEQVQFITVGRNTFSKCKREINNEGYATYSYETLWPVYNDFTDLITQFKRDQKIEDILE